MFKDRNRIFLSQHVEREELKEEYWYSYLEEDGKSFFQVYNDEELLYEQEAKPGDAFDVIFREGKTTRTVYVTPMTPPRKKWEAIAWLLGYSKYARSCDYEVYSSLVEEKRELYGKMPGYVESVFEGPNFELTDYTFIGDKDNCRNMACWISEDITKEEILFLIPEFCYPELYLKKVLWEKFDITEEEFYDVYYED